MGSKMSNRQLAPTVLFFLFIMFMSSSPVNSVITCQEALTILVPCGPFARGMAPPPPSKACCSSMRTLAGKATTRADRIALCNCYQKLPPSLGLKPDRVKAIPKYCKVKISIPFDPKVNCNTIP
ncbi:hypothetical protein BT93_J0616 [Corymbia citriodora subsp. variegata]|nr:hypothetical protein BT93_J0616 [Corymbia citriodora subsp. variegata]